MAGFSGALGSECYILYREQGGQKGKLACATKLVKVKTGGGLQRKYEYYTTEEIRGDGASTKDTQGPQRGEGSFPVVVRADQQNATFMRHCVGDDPTKNSSTRLDAMMNVTYSGADIDRTITKHGGHIYSTGSTAGDNFNYDLSNAAHDTMAEIVNAINTHGSGNWACTIGTYAVAGDDSDLLETLIDEPITSGVVTTWWSDFGAEGIWTHVIWASNEGKKENGMTIDQSMDIATFGHWGAVVNSYSQETAKNAEISGEWGMLTLGATTVGSGNPIAGNSGTYYSEQILLRCEDPAATAATVTVTSTALTTTITGGSATNLNIDITDLTMRELVDAINIFPYYFCEMMDYGDPKWAATKLRAVGPVSIYFTNRKLLGPVQDVIFTGDLHPDVTENITNVAETYFVRVAVGGAPGTATYYSGSSSNPSGNLTTTSATDPTPVYTTAGVDTGIRVFFPSSTVLTANDKWSVTTIRTALSVTQTATDPLSGNNWALKFDGSTSNVSGIMGMSFEINNSFSQDKYEANITTLARMLPGVRAVTGTFSAEFDSLQYLREWYHDQTFTVESTLSESDYIKTASGTRSRTRRSQAIYGPRVQLLGDDPNISGASYITYELPFKFLPDDTNGTTELRVTYVSDFKRM